MRKHNRKPRLSVPFNMTELFPHRSLPAFRAFEDLQRIIIDAIASQPSTQQHDLDELQEPLAEVAECIIEIASGGMSLRAWYERFELALRSCLLAKASLAGLVLLRALTDEQAGQIRRGIERISDLLARYWMTSDLPLPIKSAMRSMPPPSGDAH
jgi:hypothetical protein